MIEDTFRINSKKKLHYYMLCDAISLGQERKRPSFIPFKDHIWKFERLLRKTEYWSNKKILFAKLSLIFIKCFTNTSVEFLMLKSL